MSHVDHCTIVCPLSQTKLYVKNAEYDTAPAPRAELYIMSAGDDGPVCGGGDIELGLSQENKGGYPK